MLTGNAALYLRRFIDNPGFSAVSARARLLLAFTVLSVSAMLLASVGWMGLSNTDYALQQFERQALPDIARSLELAERTANLAAVAPYVASASGPFMLQGENRVLREKVDRVLQLAAAIPQLDAAAPNLPALLNRLEQTVNELIELTRQQLFLREDMRQHNYQLGLYQDTAAAGASAGSADLLFAASHAPTAAALARIEQRFTQLLTGLSAGVREQQSPVALELFKLRRAQLQMQQRSDFLLASTRAISEQLSGEVQRFVDRIQLRMAEQSQQVGREVASGKTGIFAITLLCIFAALLGIWMVRELVQQLAGVTRVMSRLAAGDREQQTPAIERRDEIGDLARAFQVFRDNALAMDRMTDHLQEQTRLLETVFQTINDGLSVFDEQGRLLAWNPQYQAILELPSEQLKKGMTIEQVHRLLPRSAQQSKALNGMVLDVEEVNLLRKHQPQRFERYFSNGKVVEFRSTPMPDGGFVTLYSNLTERKAIEAQLRQSQKMEVLGQLTGGVAHDFNNLLAAMVGNLQMLESRLLEQQLAGRPSGQPAPESKELRYARRALAAAERGGNLTQRLLAFARKQHLEPEPTAVDELIEGMLDLIEYSVGANINIELFLNAGDWIVNIDPSQLENALLNLAINSSAVMPDGGELTFTTRQLGQQLLNGQQVDAVMIRVTDTGSGIEAAHLARVFEPFFTTKEVGQGSGLGLSMVYGFVKQSGGDIRIHSEVGQGTRIEILLPRGEADEIPVKHASSRALAQGHQQRLLLVEDDDEVRLVAEDMLVRLGYRVKSVSSAEQAQQLLHQQADVELVFTDINLGAGMNGVQLAQQIRQHWPDLPVLFSSGLSRSQLSEHYGLESTARLLPKPYRLEALADALQHALAGE